MNRHSRSPHTSAVDDFFTQGMEGINLHRAMERRIAERLQDRLVGTVRVSKRVRLARRLWGDAIIRLGTRIAADATSRAPRVERAG